MPVRAYSNSGQVTTLDHIKRAIDWALALGANQIWFDPSWYFKLREGTPIFSRPAWNKGRRWIYSQQAQEKPWATTPSLDLLEQAANYVRYECGAVVGWKPMADPENIGAWRGDVSVVGEINGKPYDNRDHWLFGIKRMLSMYAQIAAGQDTLCIGTEYYQITKELTGAWLLEVLGYIKEEFPWITNLTYCANWGGWANDSEMVRVGQDVWQEMTYRGVSAYFPLVADGSPPSPALETIMAGWFRRGLDYDWCPTIMQSLYNLGGGSLENVVMAELGFRADVWAAHNSPGEEPKGNYDSEMQARCWQAKREVFADDEHAGHVAWSVDPFPEDRDPRSHCLNQPGKELAARFALDADPWRVR